MAASEKTLDNHTQGLTKPGLFSRVFLRDSDLAAPESRAFLLRFLFETIYDKLAVEDVTVADPTALSPSKGDQWIVASGASGAWDTHDDELAMWDGSAWVFATPSEGWRFYSKVQDAVYVYDGAAWNVADVLPVLTSKGDRLRVDSAATAAEWTTGPKAGAATIADTVSVESVAFATAFPDANYSIGLTPGADDTVWFTNKTASGFDINRPGTVDPLSVDWIAVPHEDL